MTTLLLYLLLNKPFTVLHYAEGETETVALYLTHQFDSVQAGTKQYAKPIYIHYKFTVK